jgi:hypothetical protein
MHSKQELIDILSGNLCKVLFQKKDGSLREMICTLRNQSTIKQNDKDNVIVRELDTGMVRSFRVPYLISIEVVGG